MKPKQASILLQAKIFQAARKNNCCIEDREETKGNVCLQMYLKALLFNHFLPTRALHASKFGVFLLEPGAALANPGGLKSHNLKLNSRPLR